MCFEGIEIFRAIVRLFELDDSFRVFNSNEIEAGTICMTIQNESRTLSPSGKDKRDKVKCTQIPPSVRTVDFG